MSVVWFESFDRRLIGHKVNYSFVKSKHHVQLWILKALPTIWLLNVWKQSFFSILHRSVWAITACFSHKWVCCVDIIGVRLFLSFNESNYLGNTQFPGFLLVPGCDSGKDNTVNGLLFCLTLTSHRRGHTPFVLAGAETLDTMWSRSQPVFGRAISRALVLIRQDRRMHLCCCRQMNWWLLWARLRSRSRSQQLRSCF